MKRRATKTTYLEMRARNAKRPIAPPLPDIHIERIEKPAVDFYRFLYTTVGAPYCWVDRNLLSDEQLAPIIHNERVEIYLLSIGQRPGGYSELDRGYSGEIELAYFGLFPEFTGKGLGKYFLAWTLDQAWAYGPTRLWLHTCDLDHPAALPTYLQAGFAVYDEKIIQQVMPES